MDLSPHRCYLVFGLYDTMQNELLVGHRVAVDVYDCECTCLVHFFADEAPLQEFLELAVNEDVADHLHGQLLNKPPQLHLLFFLNELALSYLLHECFRRPRLRVQ